jgi:hypothetical protein
MTTLFFARDRAGRKSLKPSDNFSLASRLTNATHFNVTYSLNVAGHLLRAFF